MQRLINKAIDLNTSTEIFKGCKKGDASAQKLLYKTYAPVLKGICIRYFKDKDECADMLQEVFIKIFDKIKQFNEEGSFEGWLKRIAVTTCIDYIRKQKSNPIREEFSDKIDVEENENQEYDVISELIELGFNQQMLLKILHQINEKQSLIFNLYCIDKLSHKEIADQLQISEAFSRKLLCKAKEAIRNLLIEYVQSHKALLVL